ncbi:MAG: carboxylesterase family protein, partial [Bacteroidetes bacterium]|nr:carboxylesterase family protein [Bacteroidota bacterium]
MKELSKTGKNNFPCIPILPTPALIIILCLIYSVSLRAQFSCYPSRYITKIFDSVQVTQDVKYGEAPKWYWPYSTEELFLDIYLPFGDTLQKRPLLILAHGGGFMVGDKTTQDIVAFCDSFARKGYVTASIEYRKGYNPLSSGDIERAAYRGTQDGKAAVRFFKAFADSFNIDTNHVFLGGHSSGAFIALHVGYQDKESERMASTYKLNFFTPDLGCLDCSGNTYPHSSRIHGVIDMSGALFDSAYIETGNDAPVIVFHGDQDDKVPFDKGKIFTLPTAPEGHGALPIVNQAQDVGLYHEFFPFYGQGHDYHKDSTGAPTTPYWDTVMNATTAFLYKLIKPNTSDITGNSSVCQNNTAIYQVAQHLNALYCWQVSGGDSLSVTTSSHKIVVMWDSVGTHTIYAAEVNEIGCVGDTQTFIVNVFPQPAAWFGYVLNGQTVVFADSSANAIGWQWDFGDGEMSNLQDPVHTYFIDSTYNVTLTITDSNGCIG